MVTTDPSRLIIAFNPAAERVFGYRGEEIFGRFLEILIPLPLRALHQRHVRESADCSEVGRTTGHRGTKRTRERLPLVEQGVGRRGRGQLEAGQCNQNDT